METIQLNDKFDSSIGFYPRGVRLKELLSLGADSRNPTRRDFAIMRFATHQVHYCPRKGVLKQWVLNYRLPPGAVSVSGAAELEEKYGDSIRHLVADNRSGYKLMTALKQRSPPLYVTMQAATNWLRKYGTAEPVTQINSAGHLEQYVGQRIRDNDAANTLDA